MVEPRKAAAAIILHDERDPHVLMVKRSEELKFMGGHHAFPGGRVDDDEGTAHVEEAEDEDHARTVHAVAREVFEETGLMLVEGTLPAVEELRVLRREMLGGQRTFDSIVEALGLTIRAKDFIKAGTWVTPATVPIRFDTEYYVYKHKGSRYEELIVGELAGLEWLRPSDARRLWRETHIKLPAPVAYVLQHLEAGPLPQVLEPLRETSHLDEERPGRIEVRCGINLLALKTPALPPADTTNTIIVGQEEIYVIDPGTPVAEEQEILKAQIDNLLRLGGMVKGILLTHSHIDHVAAAEFLRDSYKAPILAHPVTAEQLQFKVDRLLKDNELIRIPGSPDWRLRCIHTPGHDPGHVCFLEESTKTLFAGDMIANGSTIIVSLKYGGDMTAYLDSLERLLTDRYNLLIPAHGMPFSGEPQKIVRKYIRHRLAREGKVREAVEAGAKTLEELLAIAYDDTPRHLWPLAEHSLRAHLKRLDAPQPKQTEMAEVTHGL